MNESQLLSQEEIEALTGITQPAKQAEVLDIHGIFYIRRKDGKVVTTWHHVNHPARSSVANDSEPDFGAIANG